MISSNFLARAKVITKKFEIIRPKNTSFLPPKTNSKIFFCNISRINPFFMTNFAILFVVLKIIKIFAKINHLKLSYDRIRKRG